jgi:hypothetical protein
MILRLPVPRFCNRISAGGVSLGVRPPAVSTGSAERNEIMRTIQLLAFLAAVFVPAIPTQSAEDEPTPPSNRPNRQELLDRARSLSPQERQQRIQEFRDRYGLNSTNRNEWEKRREEWKNLPPEKREERLREWRQQLQLSGSSSRVLSPEEREAKRKEIKERIDAQISALQQKQTGGPITEPEQRRLERMQRMSKRLETGGLLGSPLGLPRPLPPAGKPEGPAAPNDKPAGNK